MAPSIGGPEAAPATRSRRISEPTLASGSSAPTGLTGTRTSEMKEQKESSHSLPWSRISAFRLARHHLLHEDRADPAIVSRDACGIQAQVMGAAEMALWARMHKLTRADVHSALWQSRTLVKTSCMRGTLHLLAAADFPIYMAALKTARVNEMLRIMARYHVTPTVAERVKEAVVEALHTRPLTRQELTARIMSLGIIGKKAKPWFEQSWWGVVRQAVVEGLICYGPDQNQETTFVRVEQWLPKQKTVDERRAMRALLRRYLGAYGPATRRDFSKWAGIPVKEAESVWSLLEEELLEVSFGDEKGWILREDYPKLRDCDFAEPVLRLLPSFDPYLLGHARKDHLVEAPYYKRVYRAAGWISPVVLLNGRVIGTWSHTRRGKRLHLEVEPLEKFSKFVRVKIEEEAASLGQFLEGSSEIKFIA